MDAATIAGLDRTPAPLTGRLTPALELASVVGLLELELWDLRSRGPAWLNVIVYGCIAAVFVHSCRRRQASAMAAVPSVGPGRAWFESLACCLGLSATLVIAAALVGDANETFEFLFLDKPPWKLANWLVGKLAAALVQQLALQWFLWPSCFELTRSRAVGMLLAATIFGLIHLPSPTLVAITTLAGVAWIALFRRSGRLAPLVVSHAILATLAHGSLPERLTYDMRIGLTATADLKRFEALNDPHARLVNRRLKQNRADLRRYASLAYFQGQGGTLPDFVRSLYRDILGRAASEEDVTFWIGRKLANPRDDIPSVFLASDEYAQVQERRRAEARSSTLRR